MKWIDEARADLTYAARKMRAAPAFTLVVISILAIAIGANVAVFTVIDAVLLRMLPVERPRELRDLAWIDRRDSGLKVVYHGGMRRLSDHEALATSFAYPVYAHVRSHSTVFAELFLFARRALDVDVAGQPQRLSGLLVSGNFLSGLGVRTAIGRSIATEDDRVGAPGVAVLTAAGWERTFARSPNALGQAIVVNGASATIVGVTAGPFDGVEPGSPIDVLLPITMLPHLGDAPEALTDPRSWQFRVMGRVRAGADDAHVQAETEVLVRQAVLAGVPGSDGQLPRVLVSPGGQGSESLRETYAFPLRLLMAVMAIVLLIACANVAGLLVTRATAGEREVAIRLALGAGRARLTRQVLTESVVLALMGGVFGIGLAFLTRGGLLPLLNQGAAPRISLGLSPWSVVFSAGLCLAVGLLCGTLPAIRAPRLRLSAAQARAAPGGSAGGSRLVGANTLIALQVALSLVLLIGAGLFARTLLNLRAQPIGFRAENVLLFDLDATAGGYKSARLLDFYEHVLDRVAAMPEIRSVSLSRYALLSGGRTTDTIVAPGALVGQDEVRVHLQFVSARHLETMGIPLVAGRRFTARDRDGARRVAIANQALSRRLADGGAAIGRRILYARRDSDVEIVGIAADARLSTLREPAPPTLYLPYRQVLAEPDDIRCASLGRSAEPGRADSRSGRPGRRQTACACHSNAGGRDRHRRRERARLRLWGFEFRRTLGRPRLPGHLWDARLLCHPPDS